MFRSQEKFLLFNRPELFLDRLLLSRAYLRLILDYKIEILYYLLTDKLSTIFRV